MERSGSAPAVDPSSRGSTLAGHRADLGVDTARPDFKQHPATQKRRKEHRADLTAA
jgi:hypothetical protein